MQQGLVPVTHPDAIKALPLLPGVYWLLALEKPLEEPIQVPFVPAQVVYDAQPIHRLFGCDPYGILYIGNAGKLRRRAGDKLIKLLNHHEDVEWDLLGERLVAYDYLHAAVKRLPRTNLALAFETTADKDTAKRLEQRLYHNYRAVFGERPPFNRDFDMSVYAIDYAAKRMGFHPATSEEAWPGLKKHTGPLEMEDTRWAPDFLTPAGSPAAIVKPAA
jgi:hypothetical protein